MGATLSATTMADPIQTFGQLGGKGKITNKALAIPVHLGGPWNSIEYVVLAPSTADEPTQVGVHLQRTDEVYFLLSGSGCLTTNGHDELVEAFDLVIAPCGTRHGLRNCSTEQPLAFLVVELSAPDTEPTHPPTLLKQLSAGLGDAEVFHPAAARAVHPRAAFQIACVELSSYFSAPWGALSLLRLPPGGRVGEYVLPDADELLFVVNMAEGFATITAGGLTFRSRMGGVGMFASPPGEGLSVVVPAGMPRAIENASGSQRNALIILALEVRREVGTGSDTRLRAYQEARV